MGFEAAYVGSLSNDDFGRLKEYISRVLTENSESYHTGSRLYHKRIFRPGEDLTKLAQGESIDRLAREAPLAWETRKEEVLEGITFWVPMNRKGRIQVEKPKDLWVFSGDLYGVLINSEHVPIGEELEVYENHLPERDLFFERS